MTLQCLDCGRDIECIEGKHKCACGLKMDIIHDKQIGFYIYPLRNKNKLDINQCFENWD